MTKKPINEVLAENLSYFMKEKELTQNALGALAGLGQTTIGVYLNPERRQPGKSGKQPSAKLSEVEQLADALNIDVWELLRAFSSPQERSAYKMVEQAYKNLHQIDTKTLDNAEKIPERKFR